MGDAVSGNTESGRAWRSRAAFLLASLSFGLGLAAQEGRETVVVGQVTAIAEERDLNLAVALAERADSPSEWYGLSRRAVGRLAVIVVRGQDGLDQVGRGRLPAWGAGLAFPRARVVAIRADVGDPFQILRHELAHVVLHGAIRSRVPLWFDEGYAAVAAAEFGRLEALRLSLGLALGRVPSLAQVDAQLRAGPAEASTAYGLAATAVLYLARRHPGAEISPFLDRLARALPFDSAMVLTTGLTLDRFEEAWRADVKRRHGIGLWVLGSGMWGLLAAAVVLATWLRRRRDAPRRAALDIGWVIPQDPDADPVQGETESGRPLDPRT